jgi:hypothetical protein
MAFSDGAHMLPVKTEIRGEDRQRPDDAVTVLLEEWL